MHDAQEQALVAAAQAGERRALERLLEQQQGRVYRFAMKMCRDPQDAEDVLQETLIAVARALPDFRGQSSISTWLYTIARSFCIKKRRKRKHAPEERELDAAERVEDPARTPDEVLAGREMEQALSRAIDALDPKYREVLVLRDVEGLSAQEVAEVLSLSVEAVKSRLHRARLSVRAEIAPLLGPEVEAPAPGTCPDVLSLFSQHLEGDISADVCERMERHLERCPRCKGACASLKKTLSLCRTTTTPVVPIELQASIKAALQALGK